MKKFLTLPARAAVAVAVLTLLSGATQAPAPEDADYKASACKESARDQGGEKRTTLIRGMV